jgi:hypothetical protein
MGTTFRRDVRSALYGVLTEFHVENPGLLKAAYPARPESLGELPAAWVGDIPESIQHDAGTRERALRPSVVIAWAFGENADVVAQADTLVDELVDRYTAAVRRVPTSIIQPVAVTDGELAIGEGYYRTAEIAFDRTTIREGRS